MADPDLSIQVQDHGQLCSNITGEDPGFRKGCGVCINVISGKMQCIHARNAPPPPFFLSFRG